MAKLTTKTFDQLSNQLTKMGFKSAKSPRYVVFKHQSGTPVIALPAYKPGERLRPVHQLMVTQQLEDAGLIVGKWHATEAARSTKAAKAQKPIKVVKTPKAAKAKD